MSWFALAGAATSADSAASPPAGTRRGDNAYGVRADVDAPPAWVVDPLGGPNNSGVTPGHFTIRLGGALRDRQFWWQHAASGSVLFEPKHSFCAIVDHLYSFSNVQQFPLPLRLRDGPPGTCASGGGGSAHCSSVRPSSVGHKSHVHVAVGAVDLGELAETLADSEGAAAPGVADPALRWACWPGTAHACARIMVVIRMLQYKAPTDAIVQVRS